MWDAQNNYIYFFYENVAIVANVTNKIFYTRGQMRDYILEIRDYR